MNLLLDTRSLLGWLADDPALGVSERHAIADAGNVVHVSAIRLWEIAIKQGIGTLDLPEDFDDALTSQGFRELSVQWEHARQNRLLPWLHRDPFDRMLVAQTQVEHLALVTADMGIVRTVIPPRAFLSPVSMHRAASWMSSCPVWTDSKSAAG